MKWIEENNCLHKSWKYKDFKEAFLFLTKVAVIAEKQNHHPKIENTYNKVDLWLNTHDAGNIVTEKDHQLAKAIDEIKLD